jgi:hypothetical protein
MDVRPPSLVVHEEEVQAHEYANSRAKTTRYRHQFVSPAIERGASHVMGSRSQYVGPVAQDYFSMRAALITMVQDYPGYGYFSGQVVQGFSACIWCMDNTEHLQLEKDLGSCKTVFQGHRRYLPKDHPWRKRGDLFNGEVKMRGPPDRRSGAEIDELLKN